MESKGLGQWYFAEIDNDCFWDETGQDSLCNHRGQQVMENKLNPRELKNKNVGINMAIITLRKHNYNLRFYLYHSKVLNHISMTTNRKSITVIMKNHEAFLCKI